MTDQLQSRGGRGLGDVAARAVASEIDAAFDLAASRRRLRHRFYRLSGRLARVRIAGDRLAERVHAPFAHLEAANDGSDAELEIALWDPDDCEVAVPQAAMDAVDPDGQPPVSVSTDGRWVGHRLAHTLTWLDRARSRICGAATADPPDPLLLFELGRPLYFPLMLWLRDRKVQFVHSAMVARGDDGLLLCGQGGSGKSTTSLLAWRAGFRFLADDYIGLEQCGDLCRGHGLFSSTYVDEASLARFPELATHAVRGHRRGEDKAVVLLSTCFPERLAASARIRAVILPEVTGEASTRIEPATKGYALRRAAPSSILQLLAPERAALARIAALVEAVPCHRLLLGRDVERIPSLLGSLLPSA